MKLLLVTVTMFTFLLNAHQNNTNWLAPIKQDMHVEFTVPVKNLNFAVKNLKIKNFDVTYVNNQTGLIHVLLNQDDFPSLKLLYPQLSVKTSRYVNMGPDQQYKSYDEIKDIILKVQSKFPELVHVQVIGKTLEGREIIAARISDDKEFNVDEPGVLFNALHHAREVMTVEIIEDILLSLTQGYATDENVKSWVDNLQIWLIPMVNPDGSNKVWSSDAMWRKNTRNNVGVDINRNYPYKWGACNGSSSSTSAQDYRGPSAGSEPETQVMMNFIEKTKPVYNISYHSYGEMIIHPFGCDGMLPNPADQVVETAKTLGTIVKHVVGASWQILYDVDGGDIDWMYGVHHVIPFVLEVSSRNDGFQPSYSRREPVIAQNRPGWKYLLAKASGIGLPPTRAPQQQPTTIRWGGRWFQDAQKKHVFSRKNFVISKESLRVRILSLSGRTILEHPLSPTKETQHYMLAKGNYKIQVIGFSGQLIDQKMFTVVNQDQNVVSF